jgi:hypothetical protein
VILESRVIVDPKVTREKLGLETLVISVPRETREISVSKEILELEMLDLRVIKENWVSLAKIIIKNSFTRDHWASTKNRCFLCLAIKFVIRDLSCKLIYIFSVNRIKGRYRFNW